MSNDTHTNPLIECVPFITLSLAFFMSAEVQLDLWEILLYSRGILLK